jgi:serine/threonine protein kinase
MTQANQHICPDCGTVNKLESLSKNEYRCSQCNLEMAHIDFAANGAVRGIFGWLRSAGDIIDDRYRIKSILGKGGFGVTYLVEDLRLSGKRRAIKEVPELLYDEHETTLLSRLSHPAIPDIIDRGLVDGMVFLVLEFGGNRNLGGERKLHQGRIPLPLLLPWMQQLCEVLVYLHSQDPPIIHRDLKPDNILLNENGRIMLIDFGIAKESKTSTMTRTIGRAVTHGFSPPEQAMGTGTDERSDIYALAATFYALLTGETPPAAHERLAGTELVLPSQIVVGLPSQLDDVIVKALNFNVNHRQQTMMEFSQALAVIDPGRSNTTTHRHDSADRTILLDKTHLTDPLKTHSTHIKFPDGSVTVATPASSPIGADNGQTILKHNLWLTIGAAALLFTVITTAAYVYWSKPTELPETSTNVSKDMGVAAPGTIASEVATAPPLSPISTQPAAVINPATTPNTEPVTVTSTPTLNKTGPSAMDIYLRERELQKQLGTSDSKHNRLPIEEVKAKPSNRKPQYQTPKAPDSPAYSAPTKPLPHSSPQPDNDSWLNDIHPVQVK